MKRSHTFDQKTIYQLHILGITTIVASNLIVESRNSINTKYRVPTFDRKYRSCVPKSEPYSKMSGGRGKGGCNNKGRGRGSRNNRSSGSTTNRDTTSRTELSHYTYQVGSAKQASDFITVNDYLVRHIKMTYEMGRDIGKALEDLSPFDFTGVKPVLGISKESNEALRKARIGNMSWIIILITKLINIELPNTKRYSTSKNYGVLDMAVSQRLFSSSVRRTSTFFRLHSSSAYQKPSSALASRL